MLQSFRELAQALRQLLSSHNPCIHDQEFIINGHSKFQEK
jgi:hypothetical protein